MVLLDANAATSTDARILLNLINQQLAPAAVRFINGTEAEMLINEGLRIAAIALADAAFDPQQPRAHSASLWFTLGEYQLARMALEADAEWSHCAYRLQLHARVAEAVNDRAAALRDWRTLCWQHPAAAERTLATSALLGRHWDQFCSLEVALEVPLFPAWSQLQRLMWPSVEATDAPVMAVLMQVCAALVRAPNDLALRSQLQALQPALLSVWLGHR